MILLELLLILNNVEAATNFLGKNVVPHNILLPQTTSLDNDLVS